MSYHIYQTEGFIIESLDLGESNKLIVAFTKDLGLVRASAQGVRNLRSKLRYSLQELSFSMISLVRGKEMWRVTNARKLISLYDRRLPLQFRIMLLRVLQFIKRLMPEEGKNEELFALMSDLTSFCFSDRSVFYIEETKYVQEDHISAAEVMTKLRILKVLGYGSTKKEFEFLYTSSKIRGEDITMMLSHIESGMKEITTSLQESQL